MKNIPRILAAKKSFGQRRRCRSASAGPEYSYSNFYLLNSKIPKTDQLSI